ncbi:expansin-B18-like [Corylus avellana]|uniref:expansin-B18-like n=1 Tax=Corylus avellana TaxID=13451 RepID=UPI00286ACF86|nr:expansin-B18-like [Corylus avellana]
MLVNENNNELAWPELVNKLVMFSVFQSVTSISLLFNLCFCLNPKNLDSSSITGEWSSAGATWYGSPDGYGSDGGACGYGNAVGQAPFSSMITAIGPSLYNNGKECGACYKVKCTSNPACSGKSVRVVITDYCPGGVCASDSAHFDLSGTAFGALAVSGEEGKLRDAGVLEVKYSRVTCEYPGKKIAFHVDQGSNPYYFAVVVEYEDGEGDLSGIDLKEEGSGSGEWRALQQSWGATWKLDAGGELHPPLSIRLTNGGGHKIVAKNVIPEGWQAGKSYRSIVNY